MRAQRATELVGQVQRTLCRWRGKLVGKAQRLDVGVEKSAQHTNTLLCAYTTAARGPSILDHGFIPAT